MSGCSAPGSGQGLRVLLRRPSALDWIRVGLLAGGVLCVLTGLLPVGAAAANMHRTAPLLLFLASVIVFAKLARQAQVFDVIAVRIATAGRGNYLILFLLCVAFTSLPTTVLNLDTTAVLLTPVLLALASRARIAPLPMAMTAVWLANTASLLLPVSNLTNLLGEPGGAVRDGVRGEDVAAAAGGDQHNHAVFVAVLLAPDQARRRALPAAAATAATAA